MKKDIIIGDIHLDMKHGDINFLKYQILFFNNLTEYISKNKTNISKIIFLGDIFTNNKIIDVSVLAYALKLFEDLSIFNIPIIMINGNHVIYHKNSYDVDSVNLVFKNRSNLNLKMFKNYLIMDNSVFFNWKNTKEEYVEMFEEIDTKNIEYVYGHFDLYGFLHTQYSENKDETSLRKTDIKKYFPKLKKIISGHYHIPQEDDDVLYPGIPYQLSWAETDLNLGFTILEDNIFTLKENNFKIFEKIHIQTIQDIKNYKYVDQDYNRYFKLIYDNRDMEKDIQKFKDKLTEKNNTVTTINNFDFVIDVKSDDSEINNDNLQLEESKSSNTGRSMNMEKVLNDYIFNRLNISDSEKEIFNVIFMELFQEVKVELSQNFEL